MADKRPNIVVFFWDNFGWGELGCYGGGVLRGAPTPRIDKVADQGLKLLNFNVESQCTPSRSAILTGRHAIRSGLYQGWEEPLAKEPAGVYQHSDGRPLLGRKIAGKSQRELRNLGLLVDEPATSPDAGQARP